MSEPHRKRPKVIRGDDDFLPGNITEIELHNFMTFSEVTCKPGPRLNLVIGPNGSGKSSLVCAIALGLGGEPKLLGRATSVAAFVKRGQESGHIKISLRGETAQEQIRIMRKIDTSNKSEWFFNGKIVSKKEILEIIQRFNIQVNNLTQFLPQDRVCEFAKLTPVQLLEETEKAVGDPRLPVQHQGLITKSQELKNFQRAVEHSKGSLDQLKALNAELERDVERVRQREELLAKVESMKKKLPWLQYDQKKAEYLEAQEQEKAALKKMEEAEKALKDLEEPVERKKQRKVLKDSKCKKIGGILDQITEKNMQLMEERKRLKVQVRGKYDEMEDLRRQEESRQQRISKAEKELLASEVEFANLPPYERPKEKIDALYAQILEVQENEREIRSQKSEKERLLSQHREALQLNMNRLKDMESVTNKRLQALQRSGADKIFDAYKWVQEHRHNFKEEVYGPVLLEVNVPKQAYAKYLEGQVAFYIWKAFITQNPSDRDYLFDNLKSYHVPIINHVPDAARHREPFRVTEEMRRLGIMSRLDQEIDAPDAVKDVLISQFGLEYSYIGSKETDERANEVQRVGIMDFWTPEKHYRWIKSRYSSHVSATVDSVNGSQLLQSNLDAGEIDRQKAKISALRETMSCLEGDLKELQSKLRHVEDEAAKLRKERDEIVDISGREVRKRRDMETRINQQKMRLKAIEKEDDVNAAIARLTGLVEELKMREFDAVLEMKNYLVMAVPYRRIFAENYLASIELEAQIRTMEENLKSQEKFTKQATQHHDWCKKQLEDHKEQLRAAKRKAESIAELTEEMKQAFLEMPATVEELSIAIEDAISEANSILCLNSNVLVEYESRRQKIDDLTRKQEDDEKELTKLLDEINALKGCWLPTLRSLVSQINETFGRNFQDMAVAGEVSLDEHGMDFDRYGILIKVKFRQAGQLQVLSSTHQSGGERSVSTILYLVSLQDLTNCPFRVVDEINQGMDPVNERKMFQQLVRAASQPNTPQCFLLTPKLLPSLQYSEACSILCLMNGPWIEQSSKVWSSGENWGKILRQMGASHC